MRSNNCAGQLLGNVFVREVINIVVFGNHITVAGAIVAVDDAVDFKMIVRSSGTSPKIFVGLVNRARFAVGSGMHKFTVRIPFGDIRDQIVQARSPARKARSRASSKFVVTIINSGGNPRSRSRRGSMAKNRCRGVG